jgi:type VI secretion system ImpB/VipA family protein
MVDIHGVNVGFGESDTAGSPDEPARDVFRVILISELAPRLAAAPPRPVRVDRNTLGSVMESLLGRVEVEVPDPFDEAASLRLEVPLTGLRSFKPRGLVEQVAELKALAQARPVLDRVASSALTAAAAEQQLSAILPRAAWARALMRAPGDRAPPPPPRPTSPPAGLSSLLSELLAEGPTSTPRATTAPSARQALTAAATRLLGSLIRHPEIQRLEGCWQGVRRLLESDRGNRMALHLVPAGIDEVETVLQALDGESPPDLILVDHAIEATAADLSRLAAWAEEAERLQAPLVVNGSATLLGYDHLAQLSRTERRVSASDEPRAVVARALAARPAMAWVCVCLNGWLVRARYAAGAIALGTLKLEDALEPDDAALFGGPAVLAGVLVARSLNQYGHPFNLLGPKHGLIPEMETREIDRGDGQKVALSLETHFGREVLGTIARSGIAAFTSVVNEAAGVLAAAPMFFRGEISAGSPDRPPPFTLPDQLLASQLARLLQALAVAIPKDADANAVEEVARLALFQVFENAAPPGPDILVRYHAEAREIRASIRPRRFGDVEIEELSLTASVE